MRKEFNSKRICKITKLGIALGFIFLITYQVFDTNIGDVHIIDNATIGNVHESGAAVSISMSVPGSGHYTEGQSFSVSVFLMNMGPDTAKSLSATISFSPAILGNTSHYYGDTISGMMVNDVFSFTVPAGVQTGPVTVTATADWTEGMLPVQVETSDSTTIYTHGKANLTITSIEDVLGKENYTGGEMFIARVNYFNFGTAPALNVNSSFGFGGYGFITVDAPPTITIAGNSTGMQDFNFTVLPGAPTENVSINVTMTGLEDYTNRDLTADSNETLAIKIVDGIDFMPLANFSANATSIPELSYVQFTFTGLTGDNPVTYQWNFGDGTPNATIQDPLHQYAIPGLYDVTLTVIDVDGDNSTLLLEDYINVTANLIPVASFLANQTIITHGEWISLTFTGTIGDDPPSFQWSFGDETSNSTDQDPIHYYDGSGKYSVTLTIIDANGDSDTIMMEDYITVEPGYFSKIQIVGNDELDEYCNSTGTDGLTPGTAHVIKDRIIDASANGYDIFINGTNRYLIIQNCTLTGATQYLRSAIYLWNCSNIRIENCTINGNSVGIRFYNVNSTVITDANVSSNNKYNILMEYGQDITIINNALCFSYISVKGLYMSDVLVEGNVVSWNQEISISIGASEYIRVECNDLSYNSNTESLATISCSIGSVNHSIIYNNTMIGNYYGPYTSSLFNVSILENHVIDATRGIWITGSSTNVLVDNNTIYNASEEGVRTGGGGQNCTFTRNLVESCGGDGMWILNAEGWTINQNTFVNNTQSGIELYNAINNLIYGNVFSGNAEGIYIGTSSSGNWVYLNSFLNNTDYQIRAMVYGNFYDNGNVGNYWSDYEEKYPSATSNDSIIWDTPYVLLAPSGKDNYPLVYMPNGSLAPIADFDANATTIFQGDSIQFSFIGFLGNPPTTFFWDFGDSTNSTDVNPSPHFFPVAGSYNISLNVTDEDGDSDVASMVITVIQDEYPAVNFTVNDTDIIAGEFIQFTYTGTFGNGNESYQWNFGDGTQNSTIQNPFHQYNTTGIFTVTLSVTDIDGDINTKSKIGLVQVEEDLQPVVNFTTNTTATIEREWISFTFTGDAGNAPASFQWDIGDGTTNYTSQTFSHQYIDSGTYTVILTVTDGNGDTITGIFTDYIIISKRPSTNGIIQHLDSGAHDVYLVDEQGTIWLEFSNLVVLSSVDINLTLFLDINGELEGTYDVAVGFSIEFSNDANVQFPVTTIFHAWDVYFNVPPGLGNLSLYIAEIDTFSLINVNATVVQHTGRCTFDHAVNGSGYFGIISSNEEQVQLLQDVTDITRYLPLVVMLALGIALVTVTLQSSKRKRFSAMRRSWVRR
ncbi:MAG: PKD domain-containing protein [Candidatus Hodarchaeota archaeon]